MGQGTVVAVESRSRQFVLRLANGSVWLFSQHSGQPVQVGDLLMGYVDIVGFRVFAGGGGFCRAYREAGPFGLEVSLGAVLDQGHTPIPTSVEPLDAVVGVVAVEK